MSFLSAVHLSKYIISIYEYSTSDDKYQSCLRCQISKIAIQNRIQISCLFHVCKNQHAWKDDAKLKNTNCIYSYIHFFDTSKIISKLIRFIVVIYEIYDHILAQRNTFALCSLNHKSLIIPHLQKWKVSSCLYLLISFMLACAHEVNIIPGVLGNI